MNISNKPVEFQYDFLYNIKHNNKFIFKILFSASDNQNILTIPIENILNDNNLNISASYEDKSILVQPNEEFLVEFDDIFTEMVLTSSGPEIHVYQTRFITI